MRKIWFFRSFFLKNSTFYKLLYGIYYLLHSTRFSVENITFHAYFYRKCLPQAFLWKKLRSTEFLMGNIKFYKIFFTIFSTECIRFHKIFCRKYDISQDFLWKILHSTHIFIENNVFRKIFCGKNYVPQRFFYGGNKGLIFFNYVLQSSIRNILSSTVFSAKTIIDSP